MAIKRQGKRRKKGAEFEDVLGWVHKCLDPMGDVRVREWLYDATVAASREMDVTIHHQEGDVRVLAIVEARERKTKVGIGYVEEVKTRRDDFGAIHATIVSSVGFSLPAQRKAAHHGISLMTFKEASNEDWSKWFLARTMSFLQTTRQLLGLSVEYDLEAPTAPSGAVVLQDDPVTVAQLTRELEAMLVGQLVPQPHPGQSQDIVCRVAPGGRGMREHWMALPGGVFRRVVAFQIAYRFVREAQEVPLTRLVLQDGDVPALEVFRGTAQIGGKPLHFHLAPVRTDGEPGAFRVSLRTTGEAPDQIAARDDAESVEPESAR